MPLITSRTAKGLGCPVCGSPDQSCGGLHAGTELIPVDVPDAGVRPAPATQIAEAVINGHKTLVKTTEAEARENGWPLVDLSGNPLPPRAAVRTTVSARNAKRSLRELRDEARRLDLPGRSAMTREQLEVALASTP